MGIMASSARSVLLALSWYDHRVHRGVARYAERFGWYLDARMANSTEPVWGWQGDGVLCKIGCTAVDEELRNFVLSLNLPTVDLSVFGPPAGLPALEFNPMEIGRLAAEHFLQRGFAHFAWYPNLPGAPLAARRNGFQNCLAERGFPVHLLDPIPTEQVPQGWQDGELKLGRKLAKLPQPIGILAFNDDWAVQLLRACEAVGLQVPEQVAVLGIDNQSLVCEHLAVPLSSVRLDLEAWGEQAASMLHRFMEKESSWTEAQKEADMAWMSPSEVVARRSTDVIAVKHSAVSKAVAFISENFAEGLQVADVVRASGLSRSGLKEAFRRHLHRSIHEEIQRVQCLEMRRLLRTTDWTLDRVARACGLANVRHLHRLFGRFETMTPQEYRKLDQAATD
ncbi:MAG: helix-turn-helix domain-containing protein [Planctomycetota bacterium]|nr:MAG: helix-turn-helix domain-containing protein [Planctomycetota bacterium]